jgi:hypothetical protein
MRERKSERRHDRCISMPRSRLFSASPAGSLPLFELVSPAAARVRETRGNAEERGLTAIEAVERKREKREGKRESASLSFAPGERSKKVFGGEE